MSHWDLSSESSSSSTTTTTTTSTMDGYFGPSLFFFFKISYLFILFTYLYIPPYPAPRACCAWSFLGAIQVDSHHHSLSPRWTPVHGPSGRTVSQVMDAGKYGKQAHSCLCARDYVTRSCCRCDWWLTLRRSVAQWVRTRSAFLAKRAYHQCWRVRVRFPSGMLDFLL